MPFYSLPFLLSKRSYTPDFLLFFSHFFLSSILPTLMFLFFFPPVPFSFFLFTQSYIFFFHFLLIFIFLIPFSSHPFSPFSLFSFTTFPFISLFLFIPLLTLRFLSLVLRVIPLYFFLIFLYSLLQNLLSLFLPLSLYHYLPSLIPSHPFSTPLSLFTIFPISVNLYSPFLSHLPTTFLCFPLLLPHLQTLSAALH